jgi:protein O-GlcNAc transferase
MSQALMINATMARALAHHQAGRFSQAQTLYRQVLQAVPDHADAWHLLGLLAHQQGAHETALHLIQKAIQLKPGDGGYHVNLAEAHLGLGQTEAAITNLHQAIALEPGAAIPRANLANVLYEQGKYQEAVRRYEEALARLERPEVHVELALTLCELGRFDRAREHYARAMQIDASLAPAAPGAGAR